MKKEFIPYQIALDMKELGFDEPCLGLFHNDKTFYPTQCKSHEQFHGQVCSAPLYQQAFRWFRDHFDMSSDIISKLPFYNNFDCEGNIEDGELKWEYNYRIIHNKDGYKCEVYESNVLNNFTHYEEYEEAELECLKKLIEIVKNK
jgi:hypothetical protein